MPSAESNTTGALDYQDHLWSYSLKEYLQTLGVLAEQALWSRELSPY